jgi:hypothetical protein
LGPHKKVASEGCNKYLAARRDKNEHESNACDEPHIQEASTNLREVI